MILLKRSILPAPTAAVIDLIADESALAVFCMVGGTALALQAGHRRSLDVDLMSFDDRLEKRSLNRAMRNLGATLVTPPSMISAARINGIDLLALVQDYVLDGVKVQFFVNPRARRLSSEALNIAGWRFKLMAPAGLFALKSALLLRRARSRDYFDLMWFCTHAGKTLEDIVEAARLEDDSPEVPAVVEHKLLGLIPVDPDDEGLDPLGPNLSLGDIYRFFEAEVSRREVATARALLANARRGPSES